MTVCACAGDGLRLSTEEGVRGGARPRECTCSFMALRRRARMCVDMFVGCTPTAAAPLLTVMAVQLDGSRGQGAGCVSLNSCLG